MHDQTEINPINMDDKELTSEKSNLGHARGIGYNIFKCPASISEAKAHKVI